MSSSGFSALLGHDPAFEEILGAYDSGRMHHAWVITGIEGIGKALFAARVASHVLSGSAGADPERGAERLVASESHPDMLMVRRGTDDKTGEPKRSLLIDDVLKVGAFLRRTATHGGWRVVVIEDAHTLNRNAQNALLKILEEPPSKVLILMTAVSVGALLPTIRSRCRVLPLWPLRSAALRTVLTRAQPEMTGAAMDRLIDLADGSAGFALKLLQTGVLPLFEELNALLAAPKVDIAQLHKVADQVARKADAESFDLLTRLLLDQLRGRAIEAAVTRDARLASDLRRLDQVSSILKSSETANLDRKLALINAVGALRGAA